MTRIIRMQLKKVVMAAAVMALVAAPSAVADLAVQQDTPVFTETAGNGNNIPEPGDTVSVTGTLWSFDDTQTLTGVTGTLSTTNPDVSIPSATSPYPDLLFAWPTPNTTPYSVKLGSSMECGVSVPLTLTLQTSGGSGDIPFNLPTGRAGAFASADSSDVPRSIPDGTSLGVSSTLTVGGSGRVKGLRVRIGQITHTYDGDLTITLIAPDGRSVVLVNQGGASGDNFANTVFDDSAASRISQGVAPFTGSFKPAEPLSSLDGSPLGGTWTLKVVDNSSGEIGTVDAWGIDAAPAVCDPPPSTTPPPSSDPPPPPPHDCGKHNGGTPPAPAVATGKGNVSKPPKDKPCKN
jgi:subtilisin-like proprotein convertase family protein